MSKGSKGFINRTFALAMLLLLSACSNSTTVIGPLYNRLDNQMSGGVLKLTEFEPSQKQALMQLVNHFHFWHRRDQLPDYASLLDDIETTLLGNESISRETTKRWASAVESFTRQFRECHPINFANHIIRSLSDEQVSSIEKNIRTRRTEHRERYGSSTREERIDRRVKNMIKWSGRIGFDFNAAQTAMLRDTFTRQISLRNEYFVLSDQWADQFFSLLQDRHSPTLNQAMAGHLDTLWHLLESAYPDKWQQNRDLWSDFLYELGQTMTPQQRLSTGKWLGKMGETLDTLSRSDVSFEVNGSPTGCSPGNA
ncbi:MAG: hypothetical protein KTR32_25125 [Granulosicoccus sp.]|nr:hypothetical protein [Granulosicoccus sp.]